MSEPDSPRCCCCWCLQCCQYCKDDPTKKYPHIKYAAPEQTSLPSPADKVFKFPQRKFAIHTQFQQEDVITEQPTPTLKPKPFPVIPKHIIPTSKSLSLHSEHSVSETSMRKSRSATQIYQRESEDEMEAHFTFSEATGDSSIRRSASGYELRPKPLHQKEDSFDSHLSAEASDVGSVYSSEVESDHSAYFPLPPLKLRIDADSEEGQYPSLLFSLNYDTQRFVLSVRLQQVCHLTPRSSGSATNPYVVLFLLPCMDTVLQSETIQKSLDPIFNETFEFTGMPPKAVQEQVLVFQVFDHRKKSKNVNIGAVTLKLKDAELFGVQMKKRIEKQAELPGV